MATPLTQRIAEGNPDPDRIGAFGVGFYSLFSVCEEPIVMSGDELMGFFWKGDALFTRRAPAPAMERSASGAPWTSFLMALREPTPFPETPLALSQFLATSLTFTSHVQSVALYLDDTLVCHLQKTVGAPAAIAPSRHLSPRSPERLLTAHDMSTTAVQIDARVARFVLLEAAAAAAARDRPNLRQTLAAAFSKTAMGGIASMLAGTLGGRAPTAESIAHEHRLDDPAKLETVSASLHLRMVSAHAHVSLPRGFAKEIERSTKKALPSATTLHIVYMGAQERDAHAAPSAAPDDAPDALDAHVRTLFDGLQPQLDAQGRVFIGFRTHQTTAFSGHMAARFIPTVERESLDLIDRYCARWNLELLALGGLVARATYEHEMQQLGAQWSDDPAQQAAVLDAALHVMRFFSFHRSSPLTRVAAVMETSFFECCTRPVISLLSSEGLRSSDAVRFPSAMLADFCRHIPVLPPAHIEAADVFVTALRARQLVRDITMDDVFAELAQRPLTPDEMVACLQWWCKVAAHPTYDPALRGRLVRAGVVATPSGVQALSDVATVLHPGKVPPHVPLPPTCLLPAVSKAFRPRELHDVMGWAELTMPQWLAYMISLDSSPAPEVVAQHGLTHSPQNAEAVLSTLAWAWGHLPRAQVDEIVAMLRPLACIPTRAGLQRPESAYFASVSLFHDLPVVDLPSGPVKGAMEKMLEALGVRRHVEIQLIFDRLLAAGDWSHVDLVVYLAKQRAHLSAAEMERLRHTPIFPAEGTLERFRAAQLFEPLDALRAMQVPVLAWPNRAWRASSDEAKLLWDLGLQRHLPLPLVLARAAGDDDGQRTQALQYLLDKFQQYASAYDLASASKYAFVPARDGRRYAPNQVYTDSGAAAMQFPVSALAPVDALKLQLPAHPSGAALLTRLRAAPPRDDTEARAVFGFLAGVRTLASQDYEALRTLPLVPVAARGHVAPGECYFLPAHGAPPAAFQAVFSYVDFGPRAAPFLRACGVSDEPSVPDIATKLVSDAARFYELCRDPDVYLEMLRRIGQHMDELPPRLVQAMRRAPCLLGVQQSRTDDDAPAVHTYALQPAAQIVLVDDAHAHMLFCEHVLVAPHDDVLESMYASLGSPTLSALIHESSAVAGQVADDTPRTRDVHALILERTPLFLFEKRASAAKDVQRDLAWLQQHMVVREAGAPGLQQTRVLRHGGHEWRNVQRCSAMAQTRGRQWELYIARDMELDWFEVALALGKVMLTRQPLQDVLLLMTVLSSPLRSLKRKGFHVDKILAQHRQRDEQQREAHRAQRAEEQARNRAAEDRAPPPPPSWGLWEQQLQHMFPEADPAYIAQLLRSFSEHHLAQASEALLQGSYPKRGAGPGGVPGTPHDMPPRADDVPGGLPGGLPAPSAPWAPPAPPTPPPALPAPETPRTDDTAALPPPIRVDDLSGSIFQQWKARFTGSGTKLSSLASGTSSIRRPAQDERVVTAVPEIQRHVQKAIAASRPDASRIIQSQAQTSEVRQAANNFCDVTGVDMDLRLAGQVDRMNVFVSTDLEPHATLAQHDAALRRLITKVYRPIGAIFGLDPTSLNVFCDTKGPSIAFNRGGTIYLNLRYYLAWHDADVQAGRVAQPLISVYFSVAHELAHNLVAEHNSEHEFYFSSIAEQYFMALAKYVATL